MTVRMTAPTPDTLSHWRTRSYLREPPPMSSSRLQAFTPWEQINCTDLTIQSQATTTWVNPDLDSLYSLILINDNLAVLVLSVVISGNVNDVCVQVNTSKMLTSSFFLKILCLMSSFPDLWWREDPAMECGEVWTRRMRMKREM